MSDSESDSDISSSEGSDSTFEIPKAHNGASTVDTIDLSDDDDSSSNGSFESDDEEVVEDSSDDEDESSDDDVPIKNKKNFKRSASTSSDEAPDGISKEAMEAFFSAPLPESPVKAPKERAPPARSESIGADAAEELIKRNEEEMNKRRNELSKSMHSIESMESDLEDLEFSDNEPEMVGDISIEEEAKEYKNNVKERNTSLTKMGMMRNKRDMRMAKVRERIQKKEDAKQAEEDEKKERALAAKFDPNANLDMSEDARRERAYTWYTRMGMPTKEAMKERLEMMPSSSGITTEDVDLMPWNASEKMVNVGKMQRFLNAGFKNKFKHRKKKAVVVDDDSDSD